MSQVVAANMARARWLNGWTQEELGERLSRETGRPWTKVTVSAAERSVDGKRMRAFDADELVAIARVLDVPLAWLLLPIDDLDAEPDGEIKRYTASGIDGGDLLCVLFGDPDDDPPLLLEYLDRVRRLYDWHLGTEPPLFASRPSKGLVGGREAELARWREVLREVSAEVTRSLEVMQRPAKEGS